MQKYYFKVLKPKKNHTRIKHIETIWYAFRKSGTKPHCTAVTSLLLISLVITRLTHK